MKFFIQNRLIMIAYIKIFSSWNNIKAGLHTHLKSLLHFSNYIFSKLLYLETTRIIMFKVLIHFTR